MKIKAVFKQRIIFGLIFVLVFVYAIHHIVSLFGEDVSTYAAGVTTERKILSYNGYIFRDEDVLLSDESTGAVDYLVSGGTKVGRGQKLAVVYSGGEENRQRLERLDSYIDVLERSIEGAAVERDVVAQKKQNKDAYDAIVKLLADNDASGLSYQSEKLLVGMNILNELELRASSSGEAVSLKDTLDALYAEREELLDAGGDGKTYKATDPGYFFQSTDGCEDEFTSEAAQNLTVDDFNDLVEYYEDAEPSSRAYGKMTYSPEWRIVVLASNSDVTHFKKGDTYMASFSSADGIELPIYLEDIKEEDGGTLLIFTCDRQPDGFNFNRCQGISIEVSSVSGIYVPRNAVVRENGERGVYILRGGIVYFRNIEIVYQGVGYYLVKPSSENDNEHTYIRENDMVIISGKNLFDGRVLD